MGAEPRKPRTRTKSEYSPETKAAALAALLAGQSVSSVAKEYRIPKGTVSDWKRGGVGVGGDPTQKATPDGAAPDAGPRSTGSGESIGDLLVTLLRENIKGLIAIAAVMQSSQWVTQQDAAELGTFAGIMHDKTVRMLEAMDRSAAPSSPPSAD